MACLSVLYRYETYRYIQTLHNLCSEKESYISDIGNLLELIRSSVDLFPHIVEFQIGPKQ